MQPIVDAERDGQRVKTVVLGAGAGEDEMRLRQTGQRPNEHVLVLLRGEAADIEQNRLRRGRPNRRRVSSRLAVGAGASSPCSIKIIARR